MKRQRGKIRAFLGYAGFFLIIVVAVMSAVFVYDRVKQFDKKTIALVMFGVIVALSALCTAIDFLRRRFTVDKPVSEILDATEKIAMGDFSVRLQPRHALRRYDEFDRIMENLNRMAAELSQNEVLKTDFISNVSHEIKTPLAVIQNYATALQNDKLSAEDRKKYVKTLTDATFRLTSLVMNILKLNKLENGKLQPESETVRLDEMLAETVFGFEELIESKKLELGCDFDEATVVTSPSYLEIVWNNLLSNAIKFTPEGGKIEISLKTDGRDAVVKFADTGCGISPEAGAHIFDKFYQADSSHSKEGNGLGLALVKKVIDILGGEISVESEEGKGSVFSVVLKGIVNEKRK